MRKFMQIIYSKSEIEFNADECFNYYDPQQNATKN